MAILKKDKNTKKKSGENTIGKIIYGFLLFMPLIAVGVACLYTIFNKNAYQSYSTNYVEKLQEVDNIDLLSNGYTYTANYINTGDTTGYAGNFKYYSITINWTDYGFNDNNVDEFRIYGNGYITTYRSGTTLETIPNVWGNTLKTFSFQLESYNSVTTEKLENKTGQFSLSLTTTAKTTLDNVFYQELNKLENSDLFNWSKNTATYDVVHNTTTLLGITNTYTPMLLSYWLLISVTYFIFDIALILVWAVHDKIHELKESI